MGTLMEPDTCPPPSPEPGLRRGQDLFWANNHLSAPMLRRYGCAGPL